MTITRRTVSREDFKGPEIIFMKFKKPRRPRKEKKRLKKIGLWPMTHGFYIADDSGYYPEITNYKSLSDLKGNNTDDKPLQT